MLRTLPMTPCLIKPKRTPTNSKAFSLVELLLAVAFSVLLLTGVFAFYNAATQSYSSGISGQTLQDGTNIIINKMMEGETESNVVYRLSTSASYTVACTTNCSPSPVILYSCGGNPQNTACNTNY